MRLIYPAQHVIVEVTITGTAKSIKQHVEDLIPGTLPRADWPQGWPSQCLGAIVLGANCTVKSPHGNGSGSAATEYEIPGGSATEHTLEGTGTATIRLLIDRKMGTSVRAPK